jgi:hypothetical protein
MPRGSEATVAAEAKEKTYAVELLRDYVPLHDADSFVAESLQGGVAVKSIIYRKTPKGTVLTLGAAEAKKCVDGGIGKITVDF